MKSVFFHQAAKEELLKARDYYDELNFGLGKSLIIEIEKRLISSKETRLHFQSLKKIYAKQ